MPESSLPATLTIKSGPDAGKVVPLTQGAMTLGRVQPADLVISHPEISRSHARVFHREGAFYVEDLDSSNGTFVNGKKIAAPQVLLPGDTIQLGSEVTLVFGQTVGEGETEVNVARGMAAETEASVPKPEPAPVAAQAPPPQTPRAMETIVDLGAIKPPGPADVPQIPPTMVVTIVGQEPREHILDKGKLTLGRADDNDIVVPSMIMSRHHATLERTPNGYEIAISPGVTNTLSVQGRPVTDRRLLANGDVLRIDSEIPGMLVSMAYRSPSEAAAQGSLNVQFGAKDKLTFGRDPGNDVVLDMPVISRFHAQVERVGRRYRLSDLRSVNGTFINDRRAEGDIWLDADDTIRIGPFRFVLGDDEFTRYDDTDGLRVETYHLNKWVRKDLNLLQDISVIFQPREFIVVVGQSGGGKSTLVDSIAGYRPATDGKVFVNGVDVYKNFDAVRNEVGFVPQKDIIHMELTIHQALDFAAQLRMPRDTTGDEREKRIGEVLVDLDLAHRRDIQVSGLSGGQQKRVSIGVELLTRPGLFFLDEPTSGLDPGTETALMHLMRRLADQGRTIIMVTHATKNVMLADKVVFLARGGYLAWFGPPDEALAYFDKYRSEAERRTRAMEFDQIYAILDDPTQGKPKDWAERYQASEAFGRYIARPLEERNQQILEAQAQPAKKAASKGARTSRLRQFFILSKRNITILTRDRISLILMLAAAPLVGALDLVLAPVMGRSPFSFATGDAQPAGISLFLMTIYALLVGSMSQMREFVKEGDIYKRERLVNIKILPYVTSKVWVAMLLAFYQAFCFTAIHYLAFRMPPGTFGQVYITMVLASMAGMMLGLLASALAPSASTAPMIIIMMIVPLIALSGALAPVPPRINQFASTRWAMQGLVGIAGMGSDVAGDACWALSPELQKDMTLEDKAALGCKCMGVAAFDPESCNFPGLGRLDAVELHQAAPTEPPPLPPEPAAPEFPPNPAPPADKTDPIQQVQFINSLIAFQQQAQAIQDDFRNQVILYKAQTQIFKDQTRAYLEALTRYNIARIARVGAAEQTIASTRARFSWAFVDKDSPALYRPWLTSTWLAPVVIMVVYFVLILILMKRKDVK